MNIGDQFVGHQVRNSRFDLILGVLKNLFQGQGDHGKVSLVFDEKVNLIHGDAVGRKQFI